MAFLYDLPNWLLGVVVIATVMVPSCAGYLAFHRVWRPVFSDDHKGVALAVLGVIATINSLLLAFSAISVWEDSGAADEAVVQEAGTVSALAFNLAIYDSAQSRDARHLLREYTELVVEVEWRDMGHGRANDDVWNHFNRVFRTIGTIDPDTPRRTALLPEIWARTNELLQQRRQRLFTSHAEVPGTLWTVVLIGTALTIVTTFVLPPTRFHLGMIGLITMSIGLVFYLIIAMDRPFAGHESIRPTAFETVLENMRRIDASAGGGGFSCQRL